MNELRAHYSYSQMRFHCSKQQGRTFHVTTAANSTGEAVVQYFSGQTDELPASCNSFKRIDGDNSQLAIQCEKWGYNGSFYVGMWGHSLVLGEYIMYNRLAFIAQGYYWVNVNGKWACDDDFESPVSRGDFWKVYVR